MKKLLLLPLLLLSLTSCDDVERKSPLGWCLWEIHTHENYDCEWSYIYSDIHNHDAKNKPGVSAYYITVFTDDRIGEWFCFIEVHRKINNPIDSFNSFVGSNAYKPDEVLLIDCDLAREQLI